MADPEEAKKAVALLMARYPTREGIDVAPPNPEHLAVSRVAPEVISLIHYTKGFAHTDVVTPGWPASSHARDHRDEDASSFLPPDRPAVDRCADERTAVSTILQRVDDDAGPVAGFQRLP